MKNKLRLGEGVEPNCGICVHAAEPDGDTCFCLKKGGLTDVGGHCRKYEYDPFKRVPAPRAPLHEHDKKEFEI